MKSINIDLLKVGPFKMPERQAEWDGTMKEDLEQLINEQIIPQVTVLNWTMEGSYGTSFDDPKFYGPYSLVKHQYHLKLCFTGDEGSESMYCDLDYDANKRKFSILRPGLHVDTIERQCYRERQNRALFQVMQQAESESDVLCPICGAVVRIDARRDPFKLCAVSCPNGCVRAICD